MFNWFKKKQKIPETSVSTWTEVTLADLGVVVDAESYFDLIKEMRRFCADFGVSNYHQINKQNGYFNIIRGYSFRYVEDAMAFKLRFG